MTHENPTPKQRASPTTKHKSSARARMKWLHSTIRGLVLGGLMLGVSGCSLFEYIQRKATQGNITGDSWYVQRIVVNRETFYAPQVLAAHAKWQLAKKEGRELPQPPELQSLNPAQIASISRLYEPSRLQEIAQIEEVATLNFDTQQGRIYGQSGCGSYFSSYVWSDRTHIELANGSSTRKLCALSEVARFEFRFIRELEGDFRVSQKSRDSLILESKDTVLYLYPSPNSPRSQASGNDS